MKVDTAQNDNLAYSICLFLLNFIMYAATTNATSIETNMKKVLSSLTVPFGNIANNIEER
jgi:hypothetical protein